ncbi:uncharacterized protein CCOS01_10775 [Colletotrichum costaricense]|uniref:Uncharacterized protein n=1 Tax=Colletotrichum costaricense TaxID=1209916 RepID=A0AAJ0DYH3_9PEZI|nr:uncharacterized protein CCOS01_10775 [Colletotrichum costaricense]KAK1520656.1 hypothetical protein CCOS01_10775 [Colletotrichum costaricense]
MSGSMPTIDQGAHASWDALRDQQLSIELEDYGDPTRNTEVSSRRLALMEKMRLLRYPHDQSSGQVPNAQQPPNDYKGKRVSPRFGSLSSCNIKDGIEFQLWSLEANRLLDCMEDTEGSQSSSKTAFISLIPGGITATNFNQLKSLADRLLCALAIYGLNDQEALADLEFSRKHRDMVIISHSRMVLEDRTSGFKMPRKINLARRNEPSNSRAEPAMDVLESELPIFYALIDYITNTLARIMSFNPEVKAGLRLGSSWHAITLTLLAKMSAKMKVLGHNLPGYAAAALREHSDRISKEKNFRVPYGGGYSLSSEQGPIHYYDSESETELADQVEIAALPAPNETIRPERPFPRLVPRAIWKDKNITRLTH